MTPQARNLDVTGVSWLSGMLPDTLTPGDLRGAAMEFGRAAKWSAIGGALGWSFVAWGQATSETGPPAGGDLGMLLEILQSGGLPVVLAWAAWQVRGLAMSGIPLRVQLHPEDRRLIEEIRDGRQPTQDTSQR